MRHSAIRQIDVLPRDYCITFRAVVAHAAGHVRQRQGLELGLAVTGIGLAAQDDIELVLAVTVPGTVRQAALPTRSKQRDLRHRADSDGLAGWEDRRGPEAQDACEQEP